MNIPNLSQKGLEAVARTLEGRLLAHLAHVGCQSLACTSQVGSGICISQHLEVKTLGYSQRI